MATKIVISGLVVVFEQISKHYGQFDDQVDGSLIRGRDVRVSRKKSRKYTHTERKILPWNICIFKLSLKLFFITVVVAKLLLKSFLVTIWTSGCLNSKISL